jgi:hypothetical protein
MVGEVTYHVSGRYVQSIGNMEARSPTMLAALDVSSYSSKLILSLLASQASSLSPYTSPDEDFQAFALMHLRPCDVRPMMGTTITISQQARDEKSEQDEGKSSEMSDR